MNPPLTTFSATGPSQPASNWPRQRGLLLLFTLYMTVSLALPLHAQLPGLKIGYVDASKLLDDAPQAENARQRLQKEFEPRDTALVESQRELRDLEDRLTNVGTNTDLGETERAQLEQQIRRQRREIDRARQEFREDFNIRRNEELRKLQRLVYDAIVSLAKEEGFDLIVNDSGVIFASPQVDITDKVLQRLNESDG